MTTAQDVITYLETRRRILESELEAIERVQRALAKEIVK